MDIKTRKKIESLVFKKLVESIAAGAKPDGDPLKVGGNTKSSGLGIISLSASIKTPGPKRIDVRPVGSLSTTNLFGTLLNLII